MIFLEVALMLIKFQLVENPYLSCFFNLHIAFLVGAEGGTRTRTVSRLRDPKSRAYSNFATPAQTFWLKTEGRMVYPLSNIIIWNLFIKKD